MNNLLITGTFLLHLLNPQPVVVEAEILPPTLQEQANEIAIKHGIGTTILANLIYSESRWNPNEDNGYDRGLVQINRTYWSEITDEQAFDPIWAMEWASEKIAQNKADMWTACNCYSLVKTRIKVPKMAEITPNTPYPRVNGVIILQYGFLKHIALIESVEEDGIHVLESNYKPCLAARRVIDFDDPKIVGYWSPEI